MNVLSDSRLASSSIGIEVDQLVAERRHAAWLQADHGRARLDLGPKRVEDVAPAAAWPGRACRSRRAVGRSRATRRGSTTWNPAASSTSTAAIAVCGWKWLLNVSGQSRTLGLPVVSRGAPAEPRLERLGGERRHAPPRRDPAQSLERLADDRQVRDQVDQPRRERASRAHQ